MKASNLKSFALGFGIAISALGLYALAATLTTFKPGDVVSAQLINDNFALKQDRVTGTCAAGSSIREIAVDGTVTCQADNGGPGGVTYTAGAGLALNGSAFSIDSKFAQKFKVSDSEAGLKVENTNTGVAAAGIVGSTASTNSFGVGGIATASGSGGVIGTGPFVGVRGESTGGTGVDARTDTGIALSAKAGASGTAGKFDGKVEVTGNTSLTGDVNLNGKLNKKFSSTSATLSQATPIAYGRVQDDGSPNLVVTGTLNFTVTKSSAGIYEIATVKASESDISFQNTFAVGTALIANAPQIVTNKPVTSTSSYLFYLWNLDGSRAISGSFDFVIFKL